ncbi:MAG TPA: hypothetical protein VM901_04850 [Bdellovibrionota bacterium]|nr:hypothetical protein [Bdellovibrionota bacterium]
MIKLWLIAASTAIAATDSYKFGYFDEAPGETSPKNETLRDWLRLGQRLGNTASMALNQLKTVNPKSSDEELRAMDFLITRAGLESTRHLARRYEDLGGRIVISDRWTREDLKLEKAAVISVALPNEKRVAPLLGWLGQGVTAASPKRGAYIARNDSDYDKIWFYELSKHELAKDWQWQEISLDPRTAKNVDFATHTFAANLLLVNRASPEILAALAASKLPNRVVMVSDPHDENDAAHLENYFKKNVFTHYLSTFPNTLTDEARDFAKQHKGMGARDAQLRDALVLVSKALAKANLRVDTPNRLFSALDGTSINGVTGKIKVERGSLQREVFVITQRGDERTLAWRSGLVK